MVLIFIYLETQNFETLIVGYGITTLSSNHFFLSTCTSYFDSNRFFSVKREVEIKVNLTPYKICFLLVAILFKMKVIDLLIVTSNN
jgi:hypothetical protein